MATVLHRQCPACKFEWEETQQGWPEWLPKKDLPAWRKLSLRDRSRVEVLYPTMQRIAAFKNPTRGSVAEAARLKDIDGASSVNLRKIYDVWKVKRDWRTLIDKRLHRELWKTGDSPV